MGKNGLISSSTLENEIHMIDSLFNENSKILFFKGDPKFGGGMARKLREMDNNRDIHSYANRRWSILKENITLYPLASKSLWCLNFPTCQTKF